MGKCLLDLLGRSPAGGTVLAVPYGLGLNPVEGIPLGGGESYQQEQQPTNHQQEYHLF